MSVSTHESVLFCPSCMSATIDASVLVGGSASCRTCQWKGQLEDCVVKGIDHEFASQEEIFRTFGRDVQLIVVQFGAEAIGRMLRKWGFIKDPIDSKILGRYVKAIARGIATEIVKERETIEKESAQEETHRGEPTHMAMADQKNFFPRRPARGHG